jgi:hypothetical protein
MNTSPPTQPRRYSRWRIAATAAALVALATLWFNFGPLYYSDEAFDGQVLDAQSKQPIAGVHVYGYYALQRRGFHGNSEGPTVHRFHTLTDAKGRYRFPAWSRWMRGDGAVVGDGVFGAFASIYGPPYYPLVGFYKPGFQAERGGRLGQESGASYFANHTINPRLLTAIPISDDYERFTQLRVSNGTINLGECGWEIYAPLLVAQHVEYKRILKSAVEPEGLDAEGYIKGSVYKFRDERLAGRVGHKSTRDELIAAAQSKSSSIHACSDVTEKLKILTDLK